MQASLKHSLEEENKLIVYAIIFHISAVQQSYSPSQARLAKLQATEFSAFCTLRFCNRVLPVGTRLHLNCGSHTV